MNRFECFDEISQTIFYSEPQEFQPLNQTDSLFELDKSHQESQPTLNEFLLKNEDSESSVLQKSWTQPPGDWIKFVNLFVSDKNQNSDYLFDPSNWEDWQRFWDSSRSLLNNSKELVDSYSQIFVFNNSQPNFTKYFNTEAAPEYSKSSQPHK